MKRFNFINFLLLFPVVLFAYVSADNQPLTPEQMKEDLLFFYNKVSEIHPNPYQALNEEQYEMKKQNLLNNLNTPMSVYDFWIKTAQLHPICDSHTRIAYPDDIVEFLKSNNCLYFLSGTLKINNNQLFFGESEALPDSLKNKEILKINELSSDSLIRNISNHVTHESSSAKNQYMEGWFCLFYPLLYNKPQSLNIEYTGANKKITLTSSDFLQWDSIYYQNNKNKIDRWSFQFAYNKNDKIALFELNSFALAEYDLYKEELDKAIDSLRIYDIKHLFLDISRNGGGSDNYVYTLLDYLNIPDKIYTGNVTTKISYLNDTLQKTDSLITKDYYHTKKTRNKGYRNRVYLLQSNDTFSAAVTLASFFKYYRTGLIIGEETGGLTASYTDSYVFELPHSKLLMYCASKAFIDPGGQWDGRGVLPDINYKMDNNMRSFTWEELNKILDLVEKK
jgi:hypothetical protein